MNLFTQIRTQLGKIDTLRHIRQKWTCAKVAARINHVKNQNASKIFLLATPCHGNLGDHAIVYAETQIIQSVAPEKAIIEISNIEYFQCKQTLPRYISNHDIIVIDGGGNLGTLWPFEDDKIADIISRFSKNKIIVFPQTCFYDATKDNSERITRNRSIYEEASDLHVFLRDKASYNLFQKLFPNVKACLVPDTVLWVKPEIETERTGCILCFRMDLEKRFTQAEIARIQAVLDDKGIKHSNSDTVCAYNISAQTRVKELNKKWNEFSAADLVITDRLHAMIFAAITRTPCLAVDNVSQKVSGVGAWLKNLPYIRICQDADEVLQSVDAYLNLKDNKYDDKSQHQYFKELVELL